MSRIALVAALLLTAGAISANAATPTRADGGSFVRNGQGRIIGALWSVNDDQATVMIGMFNTPGSHLVTVPVRTLATDGTRIVLNDTPSLAAR